MQGEVTQRESTLQSPVCRVQLMYSLNGIDAHSPSYPNGLTSWCVDTGFLPPPSHPSLTCRGMLTGAPMPDRSQGFFTARSLILLNTSIFLPSACAVMPAAVRRYTPFHLPKQSCSRSIPAAYMFSRPLRTPPVCLLSWQPACFSTHILLSHTRFPLSLTHEQPPPR